MAKPKKKFDSLEEAYECLDEWVEKLFLKDYIIRIELKSGMIKIQGDDDGAYGITTNDFLNKEATIYLCDDPDSYSSITRITAELVLLHELLHLVYPELVEFENREELEMSEISHMKIEQMAKSLFMAKYNLTFSWFSKVRR